MGSDYKTLLLDPRWQQCRLRIFDRDAWACRLCHRTDKTLHIHHIKYEGAPWEVEDRFLMTLCCDCHNRETDFLRNNDTIRTISEAYCILAHDAIDLILSIVTTADDGEVIRHKVLAMIKENVTGKEVHCG